MNREDYLKDGERLDDLNRAGYQIIQNPSVFCFGMDAVLLSAFAKVTDGDRVCDLGTGTGVIPILVKARNQAVGHISALEIQDISVDMATRSVKANELSDDIDIVKGDICVASDIFGKDSFDVVTSNPPYMNDCGGLKNPSDVKAIARHEVLCTLDDVVREASKLLRVNGRFYMVHRPHRLVDIFEVLRNYRLEPKRVRLVYPYIDKEANMVLIEAIKGAKPMVKMLEPLIIYKDVNEYTDEVRRLYED